MLILLGKVYVKNAALYEKGAKQQQQNDVSIKAYTYTYINNNINEKKKKSIPVVNQMSARLFIALTIILLSIQSILHLYVCLCLY